MNRSRALHPTRRANPPSIQRADEVRRTALVIVAVGWRIPAVAVRRGQLAWAVCKHPECTTNLLDIAVKLSYIVVHRSHVSLA